MSHNTKEDALAGAGVGGAFGHHQGEGHTLRDAAIGGFGADELGKHENKNQQQGKAGMGAKIAGTAEEIIGKVTNNEAKVKEGQAKKQGGL